MKSFVLNPRHPGGQFFRTIRLADREPRLVKFTADGTVELDAEEISALETEIASGVIGPVGSMFSPPTKPAPPILDPDEDWWPPAPARPRYWRL